MRADCSDVEGRQRGGPLLRSPAQDLSEQFYSAESVKASLNPHKVFVSAGEKNAALHSAERLRRITS